MTCILLRQKAKERIVDEKEEVKGRVVFRNYVVEEDRQAEVKRISAVIGMAFVAICIALISASIILSGCTLSIISVIRKKRMLAMFINIIRHLLRKMDGMKVKKTYILFKEDSRM